MLSAISKPCDTSAVFKDIAFDLIYHIYILYYT